MTSRRQASEALANASSSEIVELLDEMAGQERASRPFSRETTGMPNSGPADHRPVWLLDVDGVINASRPGWGAAPHHGTATAAGMSFRIRWAPALAKRIRALHESGRVEIRWCSTWCDWLIRLSGCSACPSWVGRSAVM